MPTGVYKRTEEAKRNMSEAQKGRKHSEETKRKISDALKGHKHSEERRRKESLAHKGYKTAKHRYGSKAPGWRGGQYKSSDGRISIMTPEHPFAQGKGYVLRSRLVMEKVLGRYLKREEVVHHIKEIDDDSPDNLQLFPNQSAHITFHNSMR